MNARRRLALASFLALVWLKGALARDAAVSALSLPQASRAEALGGAAVALDDDPALAWLTPAASASAGPTLSLGGRRGWFGEVTGQGLAGVPFAGGNLAAGVAWYDAGTAPITASDGTVQTLALQQDLLALAAYGWSPAEPVRAGAGVKLLRTSLFGRGAVSAVAADAGARLALPSGFAAGVLLRNLGPAYRYAAERVGLPTAVRAGLGWEGAPPFEAAAPTGVPGDRLGLIAELAYPLATRSPSVEGGVEYRWRGMFAVRAGGGADRDGSALTAGFGLALGPLRADYAARFGGPAGLPQAITLTFALGRRPPTAAGVPFQGRPPSVRSAQRAGPIPAPVSPPDGGLSVPLVPAVTLGAPKEWRAEIKDEFGRVVRTLSGRGTPPASLGWDGTDDQGRPVPNLAGISIAALVTDDHDRLVEQTTVFPAVAAEPRLESAGGTPLDPAIVFSLPQDEFQCWELRLLDGPREVGRWEGGGAPARTVAWRGTDPDGALVPLGRPRYAWRFVSGAGASSEGDRAITRVNAVSALDRGPEGVRLLGLNFAGPDAGLTPEDWQILSKAAQEVGRHPGLILHIEVTADAGSPNESVRQAARRGEMILGALRERFQLPPSHTCIRAHGPDTPLPAVAGVASSAGRQRVDLVVNEKP